MSHGAPMLLSVRDAAARLGLGRDATYRLVAEGRIRAVRVGRRVLVPVAELERWIARELGETDNGGAT